MVGQRCARRIIFVALFLFGFQAILASGAGSGETPESWQAEWEKTLKAAEQEGQVAYSGCGSYAFLNEFKKKFPKIKNAIVLVSCSDVVARIMTERRAGKYLADVVRLGLTSAHTIYRAKTLQPISSAFILPEVKDQSKWWQRRHHYSDLEGKYLFVPAGSVYVRFASYNSTLVNPGDFVLSGSP